MDSKLLDTEPGGESTQYESIDTIEKPPPTESGQLGNSAPESIDLDKQKAEKGEKVAENVRYGQAISESGFGGKTTEVEGIANRDGGDAGGAEDQAKSRREQGYGSESGVGG